MSAKTLKNARMNSVLKLRAEDCTEVFYKVRREHPEYSVAKAMAVAAKEPAPRFYTTFEIARRNVSLIERGRPLPPVRLHVRMMYKELHKRWRKEGGGYDTLKDIIMEPAPRFYIGPEAFRNAVYRTLRERRKK